MATYIFIPPVRGPVGGITVLYQVAAHLADSGVETYLVRREASAWNPEEWTGRVPEKGWDEMRLSPEDVWLVPEGWVNALAPGLQAGARTVLYCQNWAYLFSALPEGVAWPSLDVSMLGVSHPVSWFVEQTTGKPAPILRPGIDLNRFRAPQEKPGGPLTVAWMPRKNKALAAQVRSIFESRNGFGRVEWLSVSGLDADGVAEALGRSHIFLATGFPEGCPLPPLEAMACGCLVAGFSGFGGWDYMRQAPRERPAFTPWWPLRETEWGGNGLWSADADVLDMALNLEAAVSWFETSDPVLAETLGNARMTAGAYSLEHQKSNVLAIRDILVQQANP